MNLNPFRTCDECDGTGEVDCDYCDDYSTECEECGGFGVIDCEECDGTGEIEDDES